MVHLGRRAHLRSLRRASSRRAWVDTQREREMLEQIAEGLTNRQIGERMFLAQNTVEHYLSSLLA